MTTHTGHDMAPPQGLSDSGLEASGAALDKLTTAASDHSANPKDNIHTPSDHAHAHSWLEKVVPTSTIQSVENRFHMGNYVLDRTTGEKTWESMSIYVRLGMHLLYYGTHQEQALHWKRSLELLKAQSVKMGAQYDSPDSKAHIMPFIQSFGLESSLADMKQPDPSAYSTFNEFFAREIKESARPITSPESLAVVSSPADCRLTAFPSVDLATKYWIKGYGFTLERLFGDAALASKFDGGSLVVARLAPQDYHRWHAPVSGTVVSGHEIPGAYYTVNPQAINEPGTLDVFCENRRSVMVLEREGTKAPVAVLAVGAMLVGSIKYNDGCATPGTKVRRGQCLGAFYYGGSTVIVVFPKGEVRMDEDLVRNSTEKGLETLVKVGWRIGETPMQ